ncbi:hypothetical protein E6P97_01830 [Patescibacteria group bacterium]|nr:MAG: hypothetical protein E6P97_01830 [Patescibacteria group bacterium]
MLGEFANNTLKQKRTLYVLVLVTVVLSMVASVYAPSSRASAEDTTVGASLFSTTDPPEVTVSSPPAESTTNNPQVTVSGTTVNTTSIRVYLNGTLIATLDTTGGSFSTTFAVLAGTNTILLQAYSTYSDLTTEITRIVTYEPTVTPGDPDDEDDGDGSPGAGDSDGTPGAPNTGFLQRGVDKLHIQTGSFETFALPLCYWLIMIGSVISFAIAVTPTKQNTVIRWLIRGKKPRVKADHARLIALILSLCGLGIFLW